MAYVIIDTCTKDGLCLDACPNEAIAPKQDEAAFAAVPQLYIKADDCLDCGACASTCPNNAIFAADDLPEDKKDFAEKNAAYFA